MKKKNFKQLVRSTGYSAKEFAHIIQESEQNVYYWQQGWCRPHYDKLGKIALAIGCTVSAVEEALHNTPQIERKRSKS